MKKEYVGILVGLITATVIVGGIYYFFHEQKIKNETDIKLHIKDRKQKLIETHYGKQVKTGEKTILYEKVNKVYQEVGMITKGYIVSLEEKERGSTYFKLKDSNYYVFYEQVHATNEVVKENTAYKKYIPFKEKVVNKEKTVLHKDNGITLTLNKGVEGDIIRKEDNKYYIIYMNDVWFISKDEATIEIGNLLPARDDIAVLNYHFFYEKGKDEACNQIICHELKDFEQQLAYLKSENYMTVDMESLQLFLEGKIRLPKKSVVITVDDGTIGASYVKPMLEKYQLYGTMFLVTSWANKEEYVSSYLETHSHSDNLHNPGICPGGQGAPIKCMEKDKLLADLKKSRNLLNQSKVFCYPFYEYNDYAIDVLKEAGFEMAFTGGNQKAKVGRNLLMIPRFPILSTTSFDDFKRIIQ